jgi:sigma-B regulation protein RsbU (phosphoserine phosphatase)
VRTRRPSVTPVPAVRTKSNLPAVASVEGGGVRGSAAERLRLIESVTDVAAARLGVDDLLKQLLARVREVLEVDTAAVLLVDGRTSDLVASARVGIDDSAWRSARIPLGSGFAGRVASDGVPVVIDSVEHADLDDPAMRANGIRSLMGAPLVNGGHVMGVIHVGSLAAHRFDTEDVRLLETVAGQVALAVDARRSNVERAAAAALQRSLIPSQLPAVPGLEMAARYLPAHDGGVGGDWYDVFRLPDGRLGVVMGDVVGRGLNAAVVMGRLRSALRAYALEVVDPGEALDRLDRKIQHFEPGQMATVLYCVFDPTLATFEVGSAGHPPPVIAGPGEAPTLADAKTGLPLGVDPDPHRETSRFACPPGTLLALFTDGLVERPGEVLDRGFDRLRAALDSRSAERSCRSAVSALTPEGGWADDAALLVIRRVDTPEMPAAVPSEAPPGS